jgi:glycosyltransferase involved in cell wall biosynthesis
MKVLLITSSFPRWEGDWAGVFVLKLAQALGRLGHRVTVLAPHAPGCLMRETIDAVAVERFRYAWPERLQTLAYGRGMLPNVLENPLLLVLALPYLVSLGMRTRRLARGHDVVNAHFLIPQGLAAGLFGVRAVVSLHGSDADLPLGRAGRCVLRLVLSHAAAVTANSQQTARRAGGIVPAEKVRVIPMGVDTAAFTPPAGRDRARRGPLRIISVGRLIPLKGHRYLVGALPLVRERVGTVSLTLVGDGPEREALARYGRELGVADSVEFLGEVPHDRIAGLLGRHDIFVLPSVVLSGGRTEGLGTVLLEAMAAGLPVVGTNVGGIPDIIVDDKNGILVPERSPASIADAVVRLAGDPALSERLARAGRLTVEERFSWEKVSAQFESLFREVTKG